MSTRQARLTALTGGGARAVLELAAAAAAVDGVAPLSESFELGLQSPHRGTAHLLRYAGTSTSGCGTVIGYAQVADGSAEVVVAPDYRRRGLGADLVEEAQAVGAHSFWAHGMLPAAQALAAHQGLDLSRTLYQLTRPLTSRDVTPPSLPEWVEVETFAERLDVEELTALNAAAFASHQEQGRLTVADLRERINQPWFDPSGLIYLIDASSGDDAPPIAFHWTKIHGSKGDQQRHGEVYVIGVHPAYQGRGLARPLTGLGLTHLACAGVREVRLYVDGDNSAALATYHRIGFVEHSRDGQYSVRSKPATLTV